MTATDEEKSFAKFAEFAERGEFVNSRELGKRQQIRRNSPEFI